MSDKEWDTASSEGVIMARDDEGTECVVLRWEWPTEPPFSVYLLPERARVLARVMIEFADVIDGECS